MKKTIRKGCFETNSSSSHSISLSRGDRNYPEQMFLTEEEFGWYYEGNSNLPGVRMMYLITDVLGNYFTRDDFYESDYVQDLLKLVGKYTVVHEEIDFNSGYTEGESSCYIDHQSMGTTNSHFDVDNEEDVLDFIFGVNTDLFIDHDNH